VLHQIVSSRCQLDVDSFLTRGINLDAFGIVKDEFVDLLLVISPLALNLMISILFPSFVNVSRKLGFWNEHSCLVSFSIIFGGSLMYNIR